MAISVALCTYQGAAYLQEQLDSLLAQSLLPDEVVVRDDASTDDTWQILERFAADAPMPVRLHRNPERVGFRRNFGLALAATTGDLVSLCDQDDVWRPHRLQALSAALEEMPDALLAFSDAEMVGPSLEPLGYRLWEALGLDGPTMTRLRSPEGLHLLLHRNYVTGATTLARRELLRLALPLPGDDVARFHDAWLGLVAAYAGKVCPVPQALILYRQHAQQQTGAPPPAAGAAAAAERLQDSRRDWELGRQALQAEELLRRGAGWAAPRPAERDTLFLQQHEEHMRRRGALPASAGVRFPLVLRELVSGRYARHSRGVRSALKDLVAPGTSR